MKILLTVFLTLAIWSTTTAQDVEPFAFPIQSEYINPDVEVPIWIWNIEMPFGPTSTEAWFQIGPHTWVGGMTRATDVGEWQGNAVIVWNMYGVCGDFTGDGSADISDLTRFVDYMFGSNEPLICGE